MIIARTGTMHCKLMSVFRQCFYTQNHTALELRNANFNLAHTLYELSERMCHWKCLCAGKVKDFN